MAGASAQAPRIATRTARLTNAHPPAAAGAARIRIAVVRSQAEPERESASGGVEAIPRRVGAALARAGRLDRAPAVAGLVGLELEGHAARRQRAAGEAAAEAHARARTWRGTWMVMRAFVLKETSDFAVRPASPGYAR